jgi:hypothetical protein
LSVTPEQVERALRSWDTAEPFRPHGRLGKHLDVDEIVSLARHVAACLSTEPVRFEVTGHNLPYVVIGAET